MTKVLVAGLGLAVGMLIGAVLLLLNPIALLQGRPPALSGPVMTLNWEAGSGYRGMPLTARGLLGGVAPGEGPLRFEEPAIRYARVEVMALTPESGASPALGVRFASVSRLNSLLHARLGVENSVNVIWPARGTLFLAGSENFWPPLRDALWAAVRGRGLRPDEARYPLAPLPGLGVPLVAAGSGEFADVTGSFREEFAPAETDPAEFTGLRQLHLATGEPSPDPR